MNYKQKALDHVKSVCPELKCSACDGDGILIVPDPNDPSGNTPMQEQCNYCAATGMANTPHLEHFARALEEKADNDADNGVTPENYEDASRMAELLRDKAWKLLQMYYDITKAGDQQGGGFYKRYLEYVETRNLVSSA